MTHFPLSPPVILQHKWSASVQNRARRKQFQAIRKHMQANLRALNRTVPMGNSVHDSLKYGLHRILRQILTCGSLCSLTACSNPNSLSVVTCQFIACQFVACQFVACQFMDFHSGWPTAFRCRCRKAVGETPAIFVNTRVKAALLLYPTWAAISIRR